MASNLRFTTPAVSGSGQLRTAQSSSYLKPTALQNTYALPGEFIRLDTGEVISRNEYNSLTPEQQSLLQSQGISKFNEAEKAKVTEAMSRLVKLDSGEYVSKEDYARLTPEQQTALQKMGTAGFNEQQQAAYNDFTADNIQLGSGEWVSKADYDSLSSSDKSYLMQYGIDAYNKKLQTAAQTPTATPVSKQPAGTTLTTTQGLSAEQLARILQQQAGYTIPGIAGLSLSSGASQDIIHLGDGSAISGADWRAMAPEQQQVLMSEGITGYNAKVASGEMQDIMLQNWVSALPEGSQAQIAYNWALSHGSSPSAAAEYAAQYVSTLASLPNIVTTVPSGLQPAPTLESIQRKQTPEIAQGTALSEIVTYYQNNPAMVNTGEAVDELIGQGYTLQQITNATAAYNQLLKSQKQQTALGTIEKFIPQISYPESLQDEITIRQAKGLDVPYYSYTAETLTEFVKANPATGIDTLKQAGFSDDVINTVSKLKDMTYVKGLGYFETGTAPNYNDYMVNYLTTHGIDEDTAKIWVGQKIGIPDVPQSQYKAIENLVKAGAQEYQSSFGTKNLILSGVAVPASFIFAPARALAPDVKLSDISGAEWAMGASQALAMAAMPFGGITGGIIGKSLDIGASAAWAGATALDWDNMSEPEKIFNTVGNLAFLVLPYAASRLGEVKAFTKGELTPELRSLSDKALEAGKAVKEAEGLEAAAKKLPTSALYTGESAVKLQTARASAAAAVSSFLDDLARLDKVDINFLKVLENESGIKGLTESTLDLGKAAKQLKAAQSELEKIKPDLFGGVKKVTASDQAKIIKAQNNLVKAQKDFDQAMLSYSDVITGVKFKPSGLLEEERLAAINRKLDELRSSEAYKKSFSLSQQNGELQLISQGTPYISETGEIKYRTQVGFGKATEFARPVEETVTPITAEDIALSKRITYGSEKSTLGNVFEQSLSTGQAEGGGRRLPKMSPEDRIAVEKAALKSQINYYERLGIQPLTGSLDDLKAKLATMEITEGIPTGFQVMPIEIAGPSIIPADALLEVLTPEVVGQLDQKFNLSPEQITGTKTIPRPQLEQMAATLGLTQTEIQTTAQAGVLPAAVVYEAVKDLPAAQAAVLTQAVVASYPEISGMIQTIPNIQEWQQAGIQEVTETVAAPEAIMPAGQIAPIPSAVSAAAPAPGIKGQPAIQPAVETLSETSAEIATGKATDLTPTTPPAPENIPPEEIMEEHILTGKEQEGKLTKKEKKRLEYLKKKREFQGGIAWAQGFGWVAIKKPYGTDDITFFYGEEPPPGITPVPGGKGEAYRSIQQYLVDNDLPDIHLRRGIMKIDITKPSREPGAPGAIKFTPVNQEQENDIELARADLSGLGVSSDVWEDEEEPIKPPKMIETQPSPIKPVEKISRKKTGGVSVGYELR